MKDTSPEVHHCKNVHPDFITPLGLAFDRARSSYTDGAFHCINPVTSTGQGHEQKGGKFQLYYQTQKRKTIYAMWFFFYDFFFLPNSHKWLISLIWKPTCLL